MGVLANAFSNVVNTVVGGITNLASGVAQGVIPAVTGAATQIVSSVTPMVSNIVNSKLAGGASAAATAIISGGTASLSADAIKAINADPNSGAALGVNTASGKVFQSSGDGIVTPLDGLKKFFNYYKLTSGDLYELDTNGKKQLDWVKIGTHATIGGGGLFVLYKFAKKKRWIK